MADAAIIGATASQYTGDPAFGGGTFGFIKLDLKPLEDLAKYTMLYNKAEYEQRQKDADNKILELSKLIAMSPNDLHGKDRDEFLKKWTSTIEQLREKAKISAKTPTEKIQQALEWQLIIKEISDIYTSAKTRSIKYFKELDSINKLKESPATIEARKKRLDEIFNNSSITELFSVPEYQTATIDIPAPVETTVNTIQIGDNKNISIKAKIFSPKDNLPLATATLISLARLYPEPGTPEYQKLSEEEKHQAEIQATVKSEAKLWADMARYISSALQTKDEQGNLIYYTIDDNGKRVFNEEKFQEDNAANTILIETYKMLKQMSEYSKKKMNEAKQGIFQDKNIRYMLPSNISPDGSDFLPGVINFNIGEIKPEQLILAGMFKQFGSDVFGKEIQETDDEIQKQQLAIQRGHLEVAKKNLENKEEKLPGVKAPAQAYIEYLNKLNKYYSENPDGELVLNYEDIDQTTRKALGLDEWNRVILKKDGEIIIEKNKSPKKKAPVWVKDRVETNKTLKQGYINAIKSGLNMDGTQTVQWQMAAERMFDVLDIQQLQEKSTEPKQSGIIWENPK